VNHYHEQHDGDRRACENAQHDGATDVGARREFGGGRLDVFHGHSKGATPMLSHASLAQALFQFERFRGRKQAGAECLE